MRPQEIEPGSYDFDGTMAAKLEQARSDVIEQLRAATGISVSLITDDGAEGTHFAIVLSDDPARPAQFLVWALAKAWNDAHAALPGIPDDELYAMVLEVAESA